MISEHQVSHSGPKNCNSSWEFWHKTCHSFMFFEQRVKTNSRITAVLFLPYVWVSHYNNTASVFLCLCISRVGFFFPYLIASHPKLSTGWPIKFTVSST